MARKTNIDSKEKFTKEYEITDLIPSSISPPLLRTECRRLRRNVKRRRNRVGGSIEGFDESMDCWCVGDCGLDGKVDGMVWLNRSKNVLFRLDNVRTGDFGVGEVVFDGIGIGFDEFSAILVDLIAVVIVAFVDDDDDDDDDVGNEAKYTVSVVIRDR